MDRKCIFMKKDGNDSDLSNQHDREDSPLVNQDADQEDPFSRDSNELMERGQSILPPDTKAVIF